MSYAHGKRCAEKFAYESEALAVVQLRYLRATSRENKKVKNKLCVYLCGFCGQWHVGHDRRRRERERVA